MTNWERILLIFLPLPFTTLGLKVFTVSGNYIPEMFLFLILIIMLFGKNTRYVINSNFSSKLFLTSFFSLIGISILSLTHNDFNFITFYGRFRALLIFIIGFTVVYLFYNRGKNEELEKGLLIFTSSASLMYVINGLIGIDGESAKVGISMICFSVAICLSIEQKKYFWGALILIAAILSAYLSFFRQNYIVAAYLLFIYLFISFFKIIEIKDYSIRIGIKMFFPIVLFLVSGMVVYSYIDVFFDFLNSSESRYIQSIGKMNDLIAALNDRTVDESGNIRIQSYIFLFDNMIYYILPNGIVNDSSLIAGSIWGGERKNLGMSIVRDSILGYVIVTFGYFVSLVSLIIFFVNYIKFLILNYKLAVLRSVIIFPSIIIIFFVDGATLTQFQKSLFFGIGLALLVNFNKLKQNHG